MHDRPLTRQPHFTPLAGEVVELTPRRSFSGIAALGYVLAVFCAGWGLLMLIGAAFRL